MIRTFACATALALTVTAVIHAPANAQGRPRIILYQEDNFRGNQLELDHDVANLTEFRFNDRVSSVRVLGGAWRLCEHDYGHGRCVTVTRDEPKMDRLGMDDNITSVQADNGWGRDRGRDRDDRRRDYRDRDWDRR